MICFKLGYVFLVQIARNLLYVLIFGLGGFLGSSNLEVIKGYTDFCEKKRPDFWRSLSVKERALLSNPDLKAAMTKD